MNTIQSIKRALRIGNRINNSTTGSVLHIDSSNKLAEDNANFSYSSEKLTVKDAAISSSTASRLTATDASKKLVSVSDLTAWLIQTLKQVLVSDNGDGTVTLSLPQDIDTDADVEFDTLTLGDMTAGSIPFIGTGGLVSQDNANLFWDNINKEFNVNAVNIPVTSNAVTGVIFQNSAELIHTYGVRNLFVGAPSGNFTTSGTGENVGIGYATLRNVTTGNRNVAIGSESLINLETGSGNFGLGRTSLSSLVSGSGNVAIGRSTLNTITTTSGNVAIGDSAAQSNTGDDNVAIGNLAGSTLGSGFGNIIIGRSSGGITTGYRNIIIGYNIQAVSATANRKLNIGDTIYGDISTAKIGIGTSTLVAMINSISQLSTDIGQIIQAAAAQTANLKEYQSSASAVYSGTNNIGERFQIDDVKNWFGTGNDASIYYDGTDLIIDPKETGSGKLVIKSGLTIEGPIVTPIRKITSDYTVTATDSTILIDGSSNTVTAELPTAVGISGTEYTLKCINDTFTCTVDGNGTETIDTELTMELILHEVITVKSDGADWWII